MKDKKKLDRAGKSGKAIYDGMSYPSATYGMARYLAPGITRFEDKSGKMQYSDPLRFAEYRQTKQEDTLPKLQFDENFFFAWPPNLFALTSIFFHTTGAYALITSSTWKEKIKKKREDHVRLLRIAHAEDCNQLSPTEAYSEYILAIAMIWREKLYSLEREELETLFRLIPSTNFATSHKSNRIDDSTVSEHLSDILYEYPRVSRGDDLAPVTYLGSDDFENKLQAIVKGTCPILPQPQEENPTLETLSQMRTLLSGLWTTVKEAMGPSRIANCNDVWLQDDENQEVLYCLWTLHAVADKVCTGWGVRENLYISKRESSRSSSSQTKNQKRKFDKTVRNLLEHTGNLSLISSDRGRVLPKRHTPQVGVSLRGASSNLAFHKSSIQVCWKTNGSSIVKPSSTDKIEQVTILLVPWPEQVFARDFSAQEVEGSQERKFDFSSKLESEQFGKLAGALKKAKLECDHIDMVLVPEGAIDTQTNLDNFKSTIAAANVGSYIVGFRNVKPGQKSHNSLVFGFSRGVVTHKEDYYEETYRKHHPWILDKHQIIHYELGGRLHPDRRHWENIEIGERKSILVNLGNELTVCPIICEDLARQETLSELIQAVGPSLVVALLMDGPQLVSRWPARYATVFGDDPGCAVLTLTSIGMVNRANTGQREKSRSIALWCERGGRPREITLEPNSSAVLLSLAVNTYPETTIDGRQDYVETYSLILGGVFPI